MTDPSLARSTEGAYPAPRDVVSVPTPAFADAEIPLQLVTERMLLSALRDHDLAEAAETARARAEFLAEASLRFGASLDETLTYAAIAGLATPSIAGWCIIDVVESAGTLRRLAVLHPDDDKRFAASTLADRWIPSPDDGWGIPVVERERRTVILDDAAGTTIASTARDVEMLKVLRWLGGGSLLVVPMLAHDTLLGAITYVRGASAAPYSAEEVLFTEAFAARCAQALEAARLYATARAAWREAEAARAESEMARADAEAARREAESANATKTIFLRTMSHELRTPLNAIGGYAQLIEMGIHGPVTPAQLTDLESIRRSQVHLLGLINAVLHYAKLETGHVGFELRPTLASEAIAWAMALVAPQARARGVALTAMRSEPDPIAIADPQKLRQILVNLLSNAVKFTNRGGLVSLHCNSDGGSVAFVVSDTGIGIPADKLDAIFEPFVQVQTLLTRPHEGTGLGLAISRELSRGMNGDLTVRSTVGEGSVFTLTMPLGPAFSAGAAP